MPNHIRLLEIAGTLSFTFDCGDLPADEAIVQTGHEPNGYFWEGLITFLAPEVAAQVEFDPEAGMFAAYGDAATLDRLRDLIAPYLDDGERAAQTVRAAEAAGFEFDD